MVSTIPRVGVLGELVCPHCGGLNLHHEGVSVFERSAEDGPVHAVHCGVADGRQPLNPSARRSGVVIGLWCEGCEKRHLLNIAQHKGTTYLTWTDK